MSGDFIARHIGCFELESIINNARGEIYLFFKKRYRNPVHLFPPSSQSHSKISKLKKIDPTCIAN